MGHPAQLIERYRQWAYAMREAFQALSSTKDYRYWFDPFWVRAYPYRVSLRQGESSAFTLDVRNFRNRRQVHDIAVHTPAGLVAEPAVIHGDTTAEGRTHVPIRLKAAADAPPGVRIVAFDVTVDGKRLGEWFDCIVEVLP